MTTDDVLAYLAGRPKKDRPTELRSDAKMLEVWLMMRGDRMFRDDVVIRHGLHRCDRIDETNPIHEHAVGNAWGQCMQVAILKIR